MKGVKVASRYAKSLLELSIEKGQLEKVHADMKMIHGTIRQSRELALLLRSPIIKSDKKETILKKLFEGKLTAITSEFINVIVRKKREDHLDVVAESFVEQYKRHKNILTAVVTTAIGLDDSLRKKVHQAVKDAMRSEVEIVEQVDPSILGGFIIRVGDKQDDTSIRTKLARLNRLFSENQYVKKS